jgi:hypothetical protein
MFRNKKEREGMRYEDKNHEMKEKLNVCDSNKKPKVLLKKIFGNKQRW